MSAYLDKCRAENRRYAEPHWMNVMFSHWIPACILLYFVLGFFVGIAMFIWDITR